MKTLYLTRHAKSSWKNSELDDHDRPLNKRGTRDAPMMGDKLKAMGIYPDMLWSSTALRAKITAQVLAQKLDISYSRIQWKREIYDSDADELLDMIRNADDSEDSLMLFGHNPEFTWLANKLAGTHIENVPTSGIVGIVFEGETWANLSHGHGKLQFFIYPKLFKPKS